MAAFGIRICNGLRNVCNKVNSPVNGSECSHTVVRNMNVITNRYARASCVRMKISAFEFNAIHRHCFLRNFMCYLFEIKQMHGALKCCRSERKNFGFWFPIVISGFWVGHSDSVEVSFHEEFYFTLLSHFSPEFGILHGYTVHQRFQIIYYPTNALHKGKAVPVKNLEWPREFQKVKVPRFRDNGPGWW
jgi:hypothetical protein